MTDQRDLFPDLPSMPSRALRRRLDNVRRHMVRRCHDPRAEQFKDYGGRGIFVCDEWRASAHAFIKWAINSGYSIGLQIDRIDNNGPYTPSNCRFVTRLINSNNKRNNVRLSDGVTLSDTLRKTGVSKAAAYMRVHRGMSPDVAATMPVIPTGQHKRTRFAPDGRALVDLARQHGISSRVLYARLDRGWALHRALSVPLRPMSGPGFALWQASLDAISARLHTGPNPATAPVLSDAAQPKLPRNSRAASAHRKDSNHG